MLQRIINSRKPEGHVGSLHKTHTHHFMLHFTFTYIGYIIRTYVHTYIHTHTQTYLGYYIHT
jgi:hypothetical protein